MIRILAALEYQLDRILRRSDLYGDRRLIVDVIINLQAGALSSERRAVATLEALNALTAGIAGPVRPDSSIEIRFHQTHYVGHAREIARDLLAPARAGQPAAMHLIVSAGGDGTHGEVLSAYSRRRREDGAPAENIRFVRVPFGTGNDGADAADLAAAVRLLLGDAHERRTGRIEVRPSGMPVFYGYNIASIGLDAYVAYLTNRLKGRFAGDLYKLVADVMTLLYERVVGAERMDVEIVDGDGRSSTLEGTFLILALGISGFRRYGGGKRVLPGFENLCAIDRIGLAGKIRLKSLFYRGDHVNEPNVSMRSAKRVVVRYGRRIPLQIDGETVWLDHESFPLEMSVEPADVPILGPGRDQSKS